LDQAQIELVRHGECGFIASAVSTIADAMLRLARDASLRVTLGQNARAHVRAIADAKESTGRVENVLSAAIVGRDNRNGSEDLGRARAIARYLDDNQFGHSLREQIPLRFRYYRARIHEIRKYLRRG
jgi:hypothetical protein